MNNLPGKGSQCRPINRSQWPLPRWQSLKARGSQSGNPAL